MVRRRTRPRALVLAAGAVTVLVLAASVGLLWSMRGGSDAVRVSAWPGPGEVAAVSTSGLPTKNVSGLHHQSDGTEAGVLWAVSNAPSVLYRLTLQGDTWRPDGAAWEQGMTLTYRDGTGRPDAEGLVMAGEGLEGGLYAATERDNDRPDHSSLRVLRFDPAHPSGRAAGQLAAVQEWDLSADFALLPDSNQGLEGIAWVPDRALVSGSFVDESTGGRYAPGSRSGHGGGVFFVSLEGTGMIYGYLLFQDGTYRRVATIDSGLPVVAGLDYDAASGWLWAACDDACEGESTVLTLRSRGALDGGRFAVTHRFARPAGMPDTSNEGFALTSRVECSGGVKPVYWADDVALHGHVLRVGAIECRSR